jgi:hypothetical protein
MAEKLIPEQIIPARTVTLCDGRHNDEVEATGRVVFTNGTEEASFDACQSHLHKAMGQLTGKIKGRKPRAQVKCPDCGQSFGEGPGIARHRAAKHR